MKKITFLAISIFFFASAANASEIIKFTEARNFPVHFSEAEPISFVERGIAFYVFPDGQFDFNTQPSQGEVYYRTGRRSSAANTTYGAPAVANYGVKIEHDYLGRVRRIGNVFINYDAYNRIKRIGTVYMTYNNIALSRIGNLQIIYNRRGQIVDYVGAVKGNRYVAQNSYDSYYYGSGNTNSNSNSDFYYYKTDGTKAVIKD